MECKCKNKMVLMCDNEFVELYLCPDCLRYALKCIEIIEDVTWLKIEE